MAEHKDTGKAGQKQYPDESIEVSQEDLEAAAEWYDDYIERLREVKPEG